MLQSNFSALIDDRPEENLFRIHRRIYTDQDVFDAEMERIFEQSWTYVCHESQIPNPGSPLISAALLPTSRSRSVIH